MDEVGLPDFDVLGKRALDHWDTRERVVFSQGDLWFGTLLVDLECTMQADPIVGICDWEFAGYSDHAADIAQLGMST